MTFQDKLTASRSAMTLAAINAGDIPAFHAMLKLGVDVKELEMPVLAAVHSTSCPVEMIDLLVQHGADINAGRDIPDYFSNVYSHPAYKLTPLLKAIDSFESNGKGLKLARLLDLKADQTGMWPHLMGINSTSYHKKLPDMLQLMANQGVNFNETFEVDYVREGRVQIPAVEYAINREHGALHSFLRWLYGGRNEYQEAGYWRTVGETLVTCGAHPPADSWILTGVLELRKEAAESKKQKLAA